MTTCINLSAVFQHCVSFFQPSSKYLRISQTSPFHGGNGQKEEGDKKYRALPELPCPDECLSHFQSICQGISKAHSIFTFPSPDLTDTLFPKGQV